MKKSTTGLLLGSALVVGLSGCASSGMESTGSSSDQAWYQSPFVCGIAGGLIGGGVGYATSGDSDEDTGAAVGGVAGATAGALLCADYSSDVMDSDGDGVPDDRDQCPNTPAGVAVDAVGCPLDTDGDGVPDYQDQCPDTPAGAEVNSLGCVEDLVLRDVNFEFDSAQLTANAEAILDGVSEKLMTNDQLRIRLEGHTDSVGPAAYNKELSQRRADSVKSYLVNKGFSADNITTIGYGEE